MSDWWSSSPLSSAAKSASWWESAPLAAEPAPAAPPAADSEPRSYALADLPGEAAGNFLPSVAKQLGEMWEGIKGAATDPVGTAGNVLKLATTTNPAMSPLIKLAASAIMPKLAPEHQTQMQAVLADLYAPESALRADLEKHYGSGDALKRTIAEDPARVLLDASTIFSGGALATARGAPALSRALSTAATVTDPVALAARGVTKVAEPAVRSLIGTQSGAGGAALAEAARTGFVGGDAGVNFRRAFADGVPVEEIVAAAQEGVQSLKQRMQQVYQVRKSDPNWGWANDPSTLDFTPITKAWKDLVNSYTTKSGQRKVGDTEWNQIQKVGAVVSEWEQNPALRTADDFDGLKQRIRAIYPDGEAPQLRRAVTKMANAVSSEIKRQVPGYHRAMRDYSQAADNLWEIERAFSLNDKASMQTAMSKLQSVMRNNASTSYGLRNRKLDELEEAGRTEIRPYIAGNTLSSWEPRSLARIGSNVGAMGLVSALAAGLPAAATGAAAGLAASSPKLMGGLYHNAGRLAGLPDRAAERMLPGRWKPDPGFAYKTLGQRPRLGALMLERLQEDEEPRYASGGYFRRGR